MPELTPQERKELRELCDRATPGPWKRGRFGGVYGPSDSAIYCHKSDNWQPKIDDEILIAAARSAIPRLLSHIDALESQLRDARKEIRDAVAESRWQSAQGDEYGSY